MLYLTFRTKNKRFHHTHTSAGHETLRREKRTSSLVRTLDICIRVFFCKVFFMELFSVSVTGKSGLSLASKSYLWALLPMDCSGVRIIYRFFFLRGGGGRDLGEKRSKWCCSLVKQKVMAPVFFDVHSVSLNGMAVTGEVGGVGHVLYKWFILGNSAILLVIEKELLPFCSCVFYRFLKRNVV